MISKSRIAYALASSVSLLAFASGSAHAEEAAAAAATAAAAPSEGLTDIVVTAERRDVSQQQAPLSVSAITAETLKASNINDITGLNGTVPGLVVARSGGGERIISIRGIGSKRPRTPTPSRASPITSTASTSSTRSPRARPSSTWRKSRYCAVHRAPCSDRDRPAAPSTSYRSSRAPRA
nr:TonB-dependent receptor plug domain-containing protein [Novosphingobium sp. ST904]